MNDNTSDNISANISGDITGQVAVGKSIGQTQSIGQQQGVSDEDIAALRAQIAEFRAQIESQAPPDIKAAAMERADELEEAVVAGTPDLTTMDYVRKWFCKNVPILAGAVTSIVVNPIVGKLVEAAGDVLARKFREMFGDEDK